MMKKTLLALALLALFAANASAYEISKQEFKIQVLDNGNGVVSEKYYFSFLDRQDSNAFLQAVKENGQDLLAWGAFDYRIVPHFESPEQLSIQAFSFDPNSNVLEVKYEPDRKVAEKTSENSRVEFWRLRAGFFQSFNQEGSLIIVPKTTTITLSLPQNAELNQESLPPTVIVTKNTLTLSDVRISNLSAQYSILKPIAQPSFINDFIDWLRQTGLIYVLVAAIIVTAVVGIVKRKEISRRIEDYLADHSEISARQEEEIDIED